MCRDASQCVILGWQRHIDEASVHYFEGAPSISTNECVGSVWPKLFFLQLLMADLEEDIPRLDSLATAGSSDETGSETGPGTGTAGPPDVVQGVEINRLDPEGLPPIPEGNESEGSLLVHPARSHDVSSEDVPAGPTEDELALLMEELNLVGKRSQRASKRKHSRVEGVPLASASKGTSCDMGC